MIIYNISQGLGIAIIGYTIVFVALLLLFYIFTYMAKVLLWHKKRRLIHENQATKLVDEEINVTGEIATAIAMAIYLSRDLHDNESDILTIKKVSKTYSPWNSKIYGIRFYNR
ncbi:MAG: OadG family protein [Lentimicrobiaceae bacterium]|jgi:Na+-transporting methylmalonyl-CoA/oxaloacetate decarboxylase gamma subunit|nr:OadG family protein [Lentimicrobiaceae bacterium]MBT3454076.1 OadG family protein [Lentimicrobiaceae bacterium]MBT3819194.1 OadG family protein [Lentimicrobiaceae bacterium]MBT4060623.1 OadG family protein [Lentimicrobiaceae bacterium]MBT4189593.1 OadG family protein [Lentimicrobiaceae bacterium]